jgi:ribose/xylose/arabinose/galactoside ABC-type transport system permease subunit
MRLFASGDFLSRYVAYLALALVIIVFGVLAPDRFLTTGNLEVIMSDPFDDQSRYAELA